MTDFQAVARDLELCDVGIALTKGKRRKAFIDHRKACYKAISRQNREDGIDKMSADDIFNALNEDSE